MKNLRLGDNNLTQTRQVVDNKTEINLYYSKIYVLSTRYNVSPNHKAIFSDPIVKKNARSKAKVLPRELTLPPRSYQAKSRDISGLSPLQK